MGIPSKSSLFCQLASMIQNRPASNHPDLNGQRHRIKNTRILKRFSPQKQAPVIPVRDRPASENAE